MRTIAVQAGVSTATVSLALRGHPKISAATRERIRRIATRLGYHPDPEIGRLMHHMRLRHKPHFRSIIAALTTVPADAEQPYHAALRQSAQCKATELGYGFELFRFVAGPGRNSSLQRILRSRGMEGILLLPLSDPQSLRALLDWKRFSVVAATNGVTDPDFDHVVPHHFGNTLLLCQNLVRLGYRRIGLVANVEFDLRVAHGFSAAVIWQHSLGGTEAVAPLMHQSDHPVGLQAWFERERPDVIIVPGTHDAETVARELRLEIPGRIGFAVANWPAPSIFAGIDGQPAEIAKKAVELLHAKMQSGQRGVPAVHSETMIKGLWRPGPSARRQPKRS